ncbi:hypothetical protein [Methylobacterium trifolii]|uniref:Uncharacterized protein n=1 Tax=Methylobacterium trifolii TaxID=1003092 RepID=A0ABQ4TYZ8_9HYPH|nr:hypothetical protein [Methylobacterium trifolii]GJE60281.1 hypothetical protein MPOCJGCO_2392 [Methylobacterium trifolii]
MQQDTPEIDDAARTIAENVLEAYSRQLTGVTSPQVEQTVVTRLVEAIRPQLSEGTTDGIIEAANAVLAAWEQQDPNIRGPRVGAVDPTTRLVSLELATS